MQDIMCVGRREGGRGCHNIIQHQPCRIPDDGKFARMIPHFCWVTLTKRTIFNQSNVHFAKVSKPVTFVQTNHQDLCLFFYIWNPRLLCGPQHRWAGPKNCKTMMLGIWLHVFTARQQASPYRIGTLAHRLCNVMVINFFEVLVNF